MDKESIDFPELKYHYSICAAVLHASFWQGKE